MLGFHNVDGSWCFPSRRGAGRKGLEQQLRVLARLAHVVPLEPALRDLAEGRPLPPRAVALTFDDGYRDTLTVAAPLLQAFGLPVTAFLLPGVLSGEVNPWWERLAWACERARAQTIEWEGQRFPLGHRGQRRQALATMAEQLKRRDRNRREEGVDELTTLLSPRGSHDPRELFLDWRGARELVRAGFAIGSHSTCHAILSEEPPETQQTDLAASRRLLREKLQVPVDLLAYPNGQPEDYTTTTVAAAEATGYTRGVTTRAGWNRGCTPPYEIRRLMIRPELGLVGLGAVVRELLRNAAGRDHR